MHSGKVRAGGLGMEGAVGEGDAVTVVTGCGCRGYRGLVWLLPRKHPRVPALRIPPCGAAWFDSAAPRDRSSLAQPWTVLLRCPVPRLALAVLLRDQCPARGHGGHPNRGCCWGPEPQSRPLWGGVFLLCGGRGVSACCTACPAPGLHGTPAPSPSLRSRLPSALPGPVRPRGLSHQILFPR